MPPHPEWTGCRRFTLARQDEGRRAHLAALRELGVDLTAYLTQARADRVIELRGSNGATHVQIDPTRAEDRPGSSAT